MADYKRDRHVEGMLRAARPQPSAQLMRSLAPRRSPRRQFALAGELTAALLISLAMVGGVSYAANAVDHAVKVAKKVVVPTKTHRAKAPLAISAGGDQYRPGFGFGDPNHNHSGPPGLTGKGGEKTPPAQTRKHGKSELVATRIRVDEQAALYISVLDADGNRLVLNQNGSTVGGKTSGKQVKTIHYVILVPRSIPLQLLVPKHLLAKGATYRIHVIAVDPDGNKSETDIPFVA